jgi:hypothetical protein
MQRRGALGEFGLGIRHSAVSRSSDRDGLRVTTSLKLRWNLRHPLFRNKADGSEFREC